MMIFFFFCFPFFVIFCICKKQTFVGLKSNNINNLDLSTRLKSVMGNKHSKILKDSYSSDSSTGSISPPSKFSVKGKDLFDVIQSDQIQETWSRFCHEDMIDTIPLEEHCEGDRYYSRFVYTHSKVKLSGGRYLNANYILNHKYIASQAPLYHTVSPFFELMFEEEINLIVMLTKVIEGNRKKAIRYWPTSNHPNQQFDDEEFGVCLFYFSF